MTATLTTLVSFNGANGSIRQGSLIADANGDLFGTTFEGGANGAGTVFEIAKTAGGYASTPTTLVSFRRAPTVRSRCRPDRRRQRRPVRHDRRRRGDRQRHGVRDRQDRRRLCQHANHPGQLQRRRRRAIRGSLIADANGDLFGTTEVGGANDDGTVFEIVKTAGGYASTPTTLVSFNGANGATSAGQPDRRRQRRPVRHDRQRRGERRWHGVRDRQDRRAATPARRPPWSASTAPTAPSRSAA